MKPDYAPIVHVNGSGEHNLIRGYSHASLALLDAKKAIRQTAPHMRDYYVLPDGDERFHRAEDAHFARLKKLDELVEEFEALAAAVYGQRI